MSVSQEGVNEQSKLVQPQKKEPQPLTVGSPNIQQNLQPTTVDSTKRGSLLTGRQRLPVTLTWKNISYFVPVTDQQSSRRCCKPKVEKQILQNVSGQAKVGELIAVMGPSGSGKTTLINVLANRVVEIKGSRLEGQITVNGIERKVLGTKFTCMAVFVQQDDVLFNMQTVRETLLTAAKLRLPKAIALDEKQNRVDKIVSELALERAQNTQIGDANVRGVSGGERKRTNIGVELIQDPSLIFLDEPTSGLDSFQALNVVETLRLLCDNGCTVVASIHQPRSSIYALFDRIILLADGNIVYNGKGGEDAVAYFNKLDFHCPSYFNPADYFMDLISRDPRNEEASEKRIQLLIDAWKQFEKTNAENLELKDGNVPDAKVLEKFDDMKAVRSGFLTQISVLAKRNARQVYRDKFSLLIRLFMALFFSLFLSATYSNTNYGQKSIQDRNGVLFFVSVNQAFGSLAVVVNTFNVEKAIIMRERQAKSYHVISYYLTKFLTAAPVDALYPVIFACVMYWIVNLNSSAAAFFLFIVITVLTSFVAMSLGFVLAAFAPSVEAANAMAPLVMVSMILFGGFFINIKNVPVWLSWLQNLSIIRWSYMAFCINEFKDANFHCSKNEETVCIKSGNEVLERLSFDGYDISFPLRNLIFLFCGMHFIAYLILRFNRAKYKEVASPTKK